MRYVSLKRKVFFMCIAVLLICVILNVCLVPLLTGNIIRFYEKNTDSLLLVAGDSLYQELHTMQIRALMMCVDDEFNAILTTYLESGEKTPSAHELSEISRLMGNYLVPLSLVQSSFIRTEKGDFYYLSQPNSLAVSSSDVLTEKQLEETVNPFTYWGSQKDIRQSSPTIRQIPYVMKFRLHDQYWVSLHIILDENAISARANINEAHPAGDVVILDRSGNVVVGSKNERISALLADENNRKTLMDGSKKAIVSDHHTYSIRRQIISDRIPWTIISLTDNDVLFSSTRPYYLLVLAVTGIMMVICFFFAWYSAGKLTRPLMHLQGTMEKVKRGDLSVRYDFPATDEIGQLGHSFNDMVDEIERQTETIKQTEKGKRKAELRALQEQINPHFLYNILDMINWKAQENDEEELSDMVISLSDFFRISLSEGKSIIPLSKEFEHVRNYLFLQKNRFDGEFIYTLDLPEELGNLFCPKLILQPLVENAIYHGIRGSGHIGHIHVYARKEEGELHLFVTDDGKGFAPAKMEEMNASLERGDVDVRKEGYGCYNVNERIRLLAGPQFGLRFREEEGKTIALLKLPLEVQDE